MALEALSPSDAEHLSVSSLSGHIVTTLSDLCVFPSSLTWTSVVREGIYASCSMHWYKSIGDGYVWMLATLNLIKWKHGENEHKNFTQQFSEDFFTCLGCACVHDGLSTENPPKAQESNTALCGGREKGDQHRKKNSDLWRSGCFLYWSVGVMVTFWTVRSKGGSWKRGHWMAGKERRLLTSHCFSSFHQTSILYELKA